MLNTSTRTDVVHAQSTRFARSHALQNIRFIDTRKFHPSFRSTARAQPRKIAPENTLNPALAVALIPSVVRDTGRNTPTESGNSPNRNTDAFAASLGASVQPLCNPMLTPGANG